MAAKVPIGTRYLECTSGGSNKFYEITPASDHSGYIIRYGRIGTAGLTKRINLKSSDLSLSYTIDNLVQQKTRKGYVEKTVTPVPEPSKKSGLDFDDIYDIGI